MFLLLTPHTLFNFLIHTLEAAQFLHIVESCRVQNFAGFQCLPGLDINIVQIFSCLVIQLWSESYSLFFPYIQVIP
jgi:hypothetical protein